MQCGDIHIYRVTSGLGLGLVDLVFIVPLTAQTLRRQWNNHNKVNQTQSQTGCVTVYGSLTYRTSEWESFVFGFFLSVIVYNARLAKVIKGGGRARQDISIT